MSLIVPSRHSREIVRASQRGAKERRAILPRRDITATLARESRKAGRLLEKAFANKTVIWPLSNMYFAITPSSEKLRYSYGLTATFKFLKAPRGVFWDAQFAIPWEMWAKVLKDRVPFKSSTPFYPESGRPHGIIMLYSKDFKTKEGAINWLKKYGRKYNPELKR